MKVEATRPRSLAQGQGRHLKVGDRVRPNMASYVFMMGVIVGQHGSCVSDHNTTSINWITALQVACFHFHPQNVWNKHKCHLLKLENLYSSSLKHLKAETGIWLENMLEYVREHSVQCKQRDSDSFLSFHRSSPAQLKIEGLLPKCVSCPQESHLRSPSGRLSSRVPEALVPWPRGVPNSFCSLWLGSGLT